MPATRGQFSQLLFPGLYSIIYEDLALHPEEYSQVANVYPSTKAYEEDQLVAGLGTVFVKPEGQTITYDEPKQGGSLRATHTMFALGFQVTREMWDDDQYGIMKRVSQDFAGSIRQSVESTWMNQLNNSFTTTKGIDGVSIINTAHPLLQDSRGVGSYSNQSATNVAFSVTGVQELILLFEKMVNERGLLKRSIPTACLGPVDLQFKMQEVFHSSYKPYTGTNEVNSVQGRLVPEINHYATSTTAWWVRSEKRQHTGKFYWRTQPEFDSQDDFQTKGASYSVIFRNSAIITYWHGWAGSPGQ